MALGLVVRPQFVGQQRGRDRPIALQKQQREHAPLTGSPEVEALTVSEDCELAEEAEFELHFGTRAVNWHIGDDSRIARARAYGIWAARPSTKHRSCVDRMRWRQDATGLPLSEVDGRSARPDPFLARPNCLRG